METDEMETTAEAASAWTNTNQQASAHGRASTDDNITRVYFVYGVVVDEEQFVMAHYPPAVWTCHTCGGSMLANTLFDDPPFSKMCDCTQGPYAGANTWLIREKIIGPLVDQAYRAPPLAFDGVATGLEMIRPDSGGVFLGVVVARLIEGHDPCGDAAQSVKYVVDAVKDVSPAGYLEAMKAYAKATAGVQNPLAKELLAGPEATIVVFTHDNGWWPALAE